MAEPTFVSAGAYLAGSGATAPVAVPAGTAAGRFVVVTLFMDGAALAPAPTPPAGFQVAPGAPILIASGSGSHSLYVWWKRLTAADVGTYTFTWTGSRYREAIASLYSDVVASGDPWDLPTAFATDLVSSSTTPPVQVTSLGPDRRLIWSATNWGGGTWTAPAGFTKRAQGGAGVHTICDRSWPTASGTGLITGTCTGNDKRHAWLGALIGTTPSSSGVTGSLAAALPALTGEASGAVTVTGALDGALPALQGSITAAAAARGSITAALPVLAGSLDGALTVAGPLTSNLAPLDGSLTGAIRTRGLLAAALPPIDGNLTARGSARAILAGTLAPIGGSLLGEVVQPSGVLDGRLAALAGSLTGTSSATALPTVSMRVGPPRLAWPTGRPSIRSWSVGPARAAWPPVRPPALGEE